MMVKLLENFMLMVDSENGNGTEKKNLKEKYNGVERKAALRIP